MLAFDTEGVRFQIRAVAVLFSRDRVLVHRAETDDFWALPGGRVEPMETTPQTLVREMREELNADIRVERLLWIVENFFEYDDRPYHEIGFYHLCSLPDDSPLHDTPAFHGEEAGLRLFFEWLPLGTLSDANLYPAFLRQRLAAIPDFPEHVIHIDDVI